MRYTIETRAAAQRTLERLSRPIQARIKRAIDALAEHPFPPGVKKLQGTDSEYRIRVGDYRVIYEVHHDRLVVLVVRIGHRGDVYR